MFDFDELEVAVPVGAERLLGGSAKATGEAEETGPIDSGGQRVEQCHGAGSEAANQAEEVAASRREHPARTLAGARELLAAGFANRAESLASELLRASPAPTEVHAYRLQKVRLHAMLHPEYRQPHGAATSSGHALALAQSLAEQQPTDASVPALLGHALCLAGKRKEAEAVWERAAATGGPEGEARQLLRSLALAEDEKKRGNAAFKEAQWEAACSAYTRAVEADARCVDRGLMAAVLGNRSAARRKLGMFEEALADAEEGLRLCPGYVKARFRRALVLMQFERYAEALADLRAVHREEPGTAGLPEWIMRAEHWCGSRQRNHYAALGAPMDATQEEIKRVHKRMALRWHPDKAGASCPKGECEERFKAIQEAFEFLSAQSEHQRDIYDFGRSAPRQAQQPSPSSKASAYAAKREPMPQQLVKMGFGTVRKGDGITTCMCCGDYAESYWEKKQHIWTTDHPGFFDANKAPLSKK